MDNVYTTRQLKSGKTSYKCVACGEIFRSEHSVESHDCTVLLLGSIGTNTVLLLGSIGTTDISVGLVETIKGSRMITIKDISTLELLAALRNVRDMPSDHSASRKVFVASRKVPGGTAEHPQYESVSAFDTEIEAELNTRKHIPNKAEGKLLRRLIKQTGWTAEALRAHPTFGEQLADAQHPNRKNISKSEAKHLEQHLGRRYIGNKFKIRTYNV